MPARIANLRDAMLFCNWLSLKAGLPESEWCYLVDTVDGGKQRIRLAPNVARLRGYRLPYSYEWVDVCRAGTITYYSFGNDAPYLAKYAVGPSRSALPCGSKLPNGWGMFDMHGNVWELCHPRLSSSQAAKERYSSSELRGGAYLTPFGVSSSSVRSSRGPESQNYTRTGFRVVRRLPAE